MRPTPVWPDRQTYSAAVQRPTASFEEPRLRAATFARSPRTGSVLAWSGGRAIVFRAEHADGTREAVRFFLSDAPAAERRYAALARHLAAAPVASLLRTEYLAAGLTVGGVPYPVLTMEWVDGTVLDRHVEQSLADTAELRRLADAWAANCRALAAARIAHGDVHAGNVLVRNGELRLVDYDNIQLPDVALPSLEVGHPAFQHPVRTAASAATDAFPNTLVYLSLRATAADPALWQRFYQGDDHLLFAPADLADRDRPLWTTLRRSPDRQVAALADAVAAWLTASPYRFGTLDDVIAAAAPQPRPSLNHWAPHAARQTPIPAPPRPPAPRPPAPSATANPTNTWPPRGRENRTAPSKPAASVIAVAVLVALLVITVAILAAL